MSSLEVYEEIVPPVDAVEAAQEMSEWFSDYAYGFTDEIGELPGTTEERLARQFGEGDREEQLAKLRDILFAADEDIQPGLALYICGYPDDAIDALSEQGIDGITSFLDKLKRPVRLPKWSQPIVVSVKEQQQETSRPIIRSVQDPRTMVPEANPRVSQTRGKAIETSALPSSQTTQSTGETASQSSVAEVAPILQPAETASAVKRTTAASHAAIQRLFSALYGDPELHEGGGGSRLAWQDFALCAQTDPEIFFPEKGGSTREAKQVCLSCDVRSECLEYALTREEYERFGIWGGLSERERRKLKRRAP